MIIHLSILVYLLLRCKCLLNQLPYHATIIRLVYRNQQQKSYPVLIFLLVHSRTIGIPVGELRFDSTKLLY